MVRTLIFNSEHGFLPSGTEIEMRAVRTEDGTKLKLIIFLGSPLSYPVRFTLRRSTPNSNTFVLIQRKWRRFVWFGRILQRLRVFQYDRIEVLSVDVLTQRESDSLNIELGLI